VSSQASFIPLDPSNVLLRHSTVSKKTENGWIRPTFQHLGREAAEALLRKNEGTTIFKPSSTRSVVTRFDNNWVGCNAVCEDRHVEDYVSKDVLSVEKVADFTENGNWGQLLNADAASLKIFSVIDGHGGTAMADALTRRLHPAIVSSLRCHLAGGTPRYTDPLSTMRKCSEGALDFLSNYKTFECAGLDSKPQHTSAADIQLSRDAISDALSAAYTNLDYEICAEPLRDLMVPWNGKKVDYKEGPASAMSGACAVSVMVNEDSQEVYVAHTGDTRAVAGYWIPAYTDSNGTYVAGGWRCEVLTADHTAQNRDEVARYASFLSI
jgi:pyruvate dehydrogenase phosphatase